MVHGKIAVEEEITTLRTNERMGMGQVKINIDIGNLINPTFRFRE